jgi:hypothetical protein
MRQDNLNPLINIKGGIGLFRISAEVRKLHEYFGSFEGESRNRSKPSLWADHSLDSGRLAKSSSQLGDIGF